jgi:protein SCO1/2
MLKTLNPIERLALVLAALLLLLSGGLYLYTKINPQADRASAQGGPFVLQHQTGPVSLTDFAGKGVILLFGYTSCPDVCPSGLANLAAALARLNDTQQQQLQPIFISVDPDRDNLAQLDQYSRYFHPNLLGLTASEAAIDRVVSAYGAFYRKVEMPGSSLGYSVDHSASLYLIDRQGQLVQTLNHNAPVTELASAIQQLLQGD